MKLKFGVSFAIFLSAVAVFAVDQPIRIHSRFGTGQDHIKMTDSQKRTYAMMDCISLCIRR